MVKYINSFRNYAPRKILTELFTKAIQKDVFGKLSDKNINEKKSVNKIYMFSSTYYLSNI